jgi:hypothetical protein
MVDTLPRDGVKVSYAVLATQFLQRLLRGQTLTRRDFFALGVMPSPVINHIRHRNFVPVRTFYEDNGAVAWDMRAEEIAAYNDLTDRNKQRANMQKHAARRKVKNEAARDIQALRKAGHAIPDSLKTRAAWKITRTTDGSSKYEF